MIDLARLRRIEQSARDLHTLLRERGGFDASADIRLLSRDDEIAAVLRERLQRLHDALQEGSDAR